MPRVKSALNKSAADRAREAFCKDLAGLIYHRLPDLAATSRLDVLLPDHGIKVQLIRAWTSAFRLEITTTRKGVNILEKFTDGNR